MMVRKIMSGLLAISLLAGCASSSGGGITNEQGGTVLGALGGAAIGAAAGDGNWWAIGAGALVGGLVGNRVGNYLDERDRQQAYSTASYALDNNKDGQTASWSNPQNNTSGYTTPTKTYQSANDAPVGLRSNGKDFEYPIPADTGEGEGAVFMATDVVDGGVLTATYPRWYSSPFSRPRLVRPIVVSA